MGEFASGEFAAGAKVDLEVNGAKRRLYARIHSAGHLIDLAATNAGYGYLEPVKGYHFEDGSYVEYVGNIESKDRAAAKEKIQQELDALIACDLKVIVTNGSVRQVAFGKDQCYPCGGTHVNSTAELGKVTITKLKKKQKNFRIGYKIFD